MLINDPLLRKKSVRDKKCAPDPKIFLKEFLVSLGKTRIL